MIKQRQQRIRLGLADALDPTVICVETGLALDQALMRVGQDLQQAHDHRQGTAGDRDAPL
jgi:tight adherence protein C